MQINYSYFFKLLVVVLFTITCNCAHAQSVNLQVVRKEVEKKIKYKAGDLLVIKGEKSEIDISTWDKNYISVSLELSAQHPERAIAEEDLEYFEYSFGTINDTILVQNNITAKKETLRSGLQAFYTIRVPESCKVKLDNYFGTAVLTDLSQGIDIKSEFCNLKLKNVLGKINVNTYFGDLIGVMINGEVDIKANRSNVTLSEIEGKFNIDAYSGVIKIFANQSLLDMNINAFKSDVFFYDSELSGYNFDLTSERGDIELPDRLTAHYTKENEVRNILIQPKGELIGVKVAINVVSGDIMLGSR